MFHFIDNRVLVNSCLVYKVTQQNSPFLKYNGPKLKLSSKQWSLRISACRTDKKGELYSYISVLVLYLHELF